MAAKTVTPPPSRNGGIVKIFLLLLGTTLILLTLSVLYTPLGGTITGAVSLTGTVSEGEYCMHISDCSGDNICFAGTCKNQDDARTAFQTKVGTIYDRTEGAEMREDLLEVWGDVLE